MNEQKRQRALRAFSAMGSLPDDYVIAAENALYEAEAGLYRPEKTKGPLRRFMSSGWGVALISGIAALTAVMCIIRAGQDPAGVTPPPPVNPSVGTSVPNGEAANFTIATEKRVYGTAVDRIVVEVTGTRLGETVTSPGGWHLERILEEGCETVTGCFYTEEFIIADAAPTEYASFKKTIFIDGGLTGGQYRLHATQYNGEAYESVAFCEFEVHGGTDAVEPGFGNFTVATEKKVYPDGTTSFLVILTGKNPGENISLPDSWHLYRLTEEGEEPVLGMYFTAEAMEGIAPDENTCATLSKRIFINPHNSDGGLKPDTYVLRAVWKEGTVDCTFEVTSAETKTSPEIWGFFMADGDPLGGNALPPMMTLWDDGSFRLRFGESDSHAQSGHYAEVNGVLTLYASDGAVWGFEPENNHLWWFYRAELSSASTADHLPDGCKFGYTLHETFGVSEDEQVKETYATAENLMVFMKPASLSLLENGEFYLDLMPYFSSNSADYNNPRGTYEEADGRLYLKSDSDGSRLVFERTEGHLRLLTEESSGPCLTKFEKNCLFYNMSLLTGATDQP